MKLALIAFTGAGSRLCAELAGGLTGLGYSCGGYVPSRFLESCQDEKVFPLEELLGQWTGRQFQEADGLIYIGAVGIAVRAIAPFLRDKLTDPAVVVVDEGGRYAISLLSGHVGGANRLAGIVAGLIGAEPVITTATDGRGLTSIDSWATRRGLILENREQAKMIAAALLDGQEIGFFSDFPLSGSLPPEYIYGQSREQNVWITVRRGAEERTQDGNSDLVPVGENDPVSAEASDRVPAEASDRISAEVSDRISARNLRVSAGDLEPVPTGALRLIPPVLTLGIGCRKDVLRDVIEGVTDRVFREANLEKRAVARIASIDRKQSEEGLVRLAEAWQVPFVTFSAGELEEVKEPVEESDFVRQVTGTGNVCERAALLAAGPGSRLLVRKQASSGVTVAVAMGAFRIEER